MRRKFERIGKKFHQIVLEIRPDRLEIPPDCAGNSTRPAGNSSRSGAGFSQPTLEMSPTPACFCHFPHFPGGLCNGLSGGVATLPCQFPPVHAWVLQHLANYPVIPDTSNFTGNFTGNTAAIFRYLVIALSYWGNRCKP